MAWSRALQKCIIFHFLDKFFLQTFLLYNWICDKKFNFCKFANFFADSKSRAQKLSSYESFVIFGDKTWDLEGGGSNSPPQHILVFKYPSRYRVKMIMGKQKTFFNKNEILFRLTCSEKTLTFI